MHSPHKPVSALCTVCFHFNQAADLSDPLLLKVHVFISETIRCVLGSNENLHARTHTHTPETSAAESYCVIITGHVRYGERGRLGSEGSKGFNRLILLRGGVALKAELISLVKSQREEPQCEPECKSANFIENINDIHDFKGI